MKVFITGDRTGAGIYPTQVVFEIIRAQAKGATVVTGTLASGVEYLVREVKAQVEEFTFEVVEHSLLDNGKPDFTKYAEAVAAMEDLAEIVVIHADPHSSSVVKAFLAAAEDKTRLVTPAELLG